MQVFVAKLTNDFLGEDLIITPHAATRWKERGGGNPLATAIRDAVPLGEAVGNELLLVWKRVVFSTRQRGSARVVTTCLDQDSAEGRMIARRSHVLKKCRNIAGEAQQVLFADDEVLASLVQRATAAMGQAKELAVDKRETLRSQANQCAGELSALLAMIQKEQANRRLLQRIRDHAANAEADKKHFGDVVRETYGDEEFMRIATIANSRRPTP